MPFTTIPLTIEKESDALTNRAEELIRSLIVRQDKHLERPTVLVGSGISLWQPTGLPSGKNFTQAMYTVLFEKHLELSRAEEILLEKIFGRTWSREFSGMPFEHLMECCPSEAKANTLINELYTSRRPNPLHEALANGLKDGLIHSIITTNYDCCLDEALDRLATNYTKVVTSGEAEKVLQASIESCYFKIHGSAEPGLEQTPMFSLKHEGLLNPHKRRLLAQLTAHRPLVLLGYSGLDFELCPEIERSAVKEIVWNDLYDEPPSVSAQRLLEKKGGYLVYGDIRVFTRHWLGTKGFPIATEDKKDVVKNTVEAVFSEEEISLWRIKVLNSLGLPSFVFRALKNAEISSQNRYLTAIHRGRAHFHAGAYKTARQSFKTAFRNAASQKDWVRAADALLEISDAYRSFGAPVRAYLCTLPVTALRLNNLRTKKLIKQALVLKDWLEIIRAVPRVFVEKFGTIPLFATDFVGRRLQVALRKKLIDCAQESLDIGNWIDFQQTALIAEGLNVDLSAAARDDYYLPPKAAEGYRHLAYYIPQTMVFYDRCLREKAERTDSQEVSREWRRHVKLCKRLSIKSSLWKILALNSSERIRMEARKVFAWCEYGRCKRLLDWKKFTRKTQN